MFERFNVEKEIEKALRRKIWLNSGGYLFFDRTEAMYTIDVNSGRSSSTASGVMSKKRLYGLTWKLLKKSQDSSTSATSADLLFATSSICACRKNQRRVLENLKECMKDDSAKCTILGMSEFGLVEMTRQRNRESLAQTIFTDCPYCSGNGTIKSYESSSIEIERALKKLLFHYKEKDLCLVSHPQLDNYLNESDKEYYRSLANKAATTIDFKTRDTLHLNQFVFCNVSNHAAYRDVIFNGRNFFFKKTR